jgi:hypothetical protein
MLARIVGHARAQGEARAKAERERDQLRGIMD